MAGFAARRLGERDHEGVAFRKEGDGRGGRTFESTKLYDGTYRLHIRCDVKGGGEGQGILTVKSEDAFELQMTTKEGKRSIFSTKTGHRVGDCANQGSEVHDE